MAILKHKNKIFEQSKKVARKIRTFGNCFVGDLEIKH
jgi:hypothetical protein